jgi:hypothetical protein
LEKKLQPRIFAAKWTMPRCFCHAPKKLFVNCYLSFEFFIANRPVYLVDTAQTATKNIATTKPDAAAMICQPHHKTVPEAGGMPVSNVF